MRFDSTTASVAFVAAVLALAAYAAYAGGDGLRPGDRLDTEEVERLVVEIANEEREERGLQPLEHDGGLREAAHLHAEDMAERDYVGHEGSDGSRPLDRYGEACDGTVGENAANTWHDRNIVYGDAEEVMHLDTEREVAEHLVRKWRESEGHRDTLYSELWRSTGVGVSVGEGNELYAAQAFCSE